MEAFSLHGYVYQRYAFNKEHDLFSYKLVL